MMAKKGAEMNRKYGRNLIAQAMIEYMLLLAVVISIVLVGFKTYLPQSKNSSELFFNRVGVGIMGEAPICGNSFVDEGECDPDNCCTFDCENFGPGCPDLPPPPPP